MSAAEIEYVHAHTAQESVAYLFRDGQGLAEAERLRPSLDYRPYLGSMVPEATLHEALGYLKGRCRLAVCTNRTNTISAVLEHHGVAGYFDLVVSAFDVPRPKPFPDQLLKALETLGCPPEASLYVGDSALDQSAARAAAVPFVAYRNPSLEASSHISHLAELRAII
jgi:HAD superfamily hydrolase (TIGR01549 family)